MPSKITPILLADPHTAITKNYKINLGLIKKQLNSLKKNKIRID